MAHIKVSQEDYDFLKELQHELQTQTNDGNADPVYWGVMETKTVGVPEGCGDPVIYMGDGATMTAEEAVKYIEDGYLKDLDEANQEEWNENVDKGSMDDVVSFMNNNLGWKDISIVYECREDVISRYTGAFLTKRACKEYIDRYGYNHCSPHTYAMTAFRNYELERLLDILKTMVMDDRPMSTQETIQTLRTRYPVQKSKTEPVDDLKKQRHRKNPRMQFEIATFDRKDLISKAYEWCKKNLPLKDGCGIVYQVDELFIITSSQAIVDKVNKHFGSSFSFGIEGGRRYFLT